MKDDFYSMPDINPKNILRSQKDKQNVVFVVSYKRNLFRVEPDQGGGFCRPT